ncbi:GNAT family N-acetyltransferase [Jiella sp. MQZ9-1]|uniref:GNAT family N-acetyltransferase n=1 Tax=Jiella flava TaxID=2816857 RepID=A0A939FXN1_9HYPH|nr:GNAT family N-acetyltransferase [Jiella flava]MBO0661274.1 GNAT family N-acetyltransferase [Jiella flava]MCD2469919.1 GNAT family N-acetyltransferase [Jiella flava]
MPTITTAIRFADPKDATALACVHEAAWRGAYAGIIPHGCLNAIIDRRRHDWWTRAIRNGAGILVADFCGETVGYATMGPNRTQALAVKGEIYELYLKPSHQGVGFGRRLFAASQKLLREREMESHAVWALDENAMATGFYEWLGGVPMAEGEERFGATTLRKLAFAWHG